MRTALIVGGVALGLYWLWKCGEPPKNPNTVNPATSMTGSGQAATIWGPGGASDGTIPGRVYDSAAAKAAAKAFAAAPTTSRLSYFRAVMAQSAPTPQSPAPIPPSAQSHYVRGTTAVTQIT